MDVSEPLPIEVRQEYGLIVDRTALDLGYFLVETFTTRSRAMEAAAAYQPTPPGPVTVKVRTVTLTEWQNLNEGDNNE